MSTTSRPRARDLGIKIGILEPGRWNAITDVPNVLVGHATLQQGEGDLLPGSGPVRTGVTAILPHRGNLFNDKVPAAVHTINGFGKATGFEQIRELGQLETPVLLTNTLNVGKVWDALTGWVIQHNLPGEVQSLNPVVGECNDSYLNDIQGRHVGEAEVFQALSSAGSGAVPEGAVGAGTGMTCYEFKGGVGTSSRIVGDYVLGVLVVSNFGRRYQLMVNGVPIGSALERWQALSRESEGSVMIVVATNAPLNDRQLGRVARRTGMGLARTGSVIGHGSGDFAIAFSNAQTIPTKAKGKLRCMDVLVEQELGNFFQAVVEATEEAVLNSLFAAETVYGHSGHVSHAIPLEEVVEMMHRYGHPDIHLP